MSTVGPKIDRPLTAVDTARELGACLASPNKPMSLHAPAWDNPLLTIPQAMARLNVSRAWIYKMKKLGKINVTKLGGMARIRLSEVNRLLEHGTEPPKP